MTAIKLVVCSNYELEFRTLLREDCFSGLNLVVYPAVCDIPEASRPDRPLLHQGEGGPVIVPFEGECTPACFCAGTGGNPRQRLKQCVSMVAGEDLIQARIRQGCYLLTPGWLARWPDHIAHWGFDRSSACQFFGESIERFLLLDTGVDPRALTRLEELTCFTGRPGEVLPAGLSFLRLHLKLLLRESELAWQTRETSASLALANRKMADYAAGFDLLGALSRALTEPEAIEQIASIFQILFMPRELAFIKGTGQTGYSCQIFTGDFCLARYERDLATMAQGHAPTTDGTGFILQLNAGQEPAGFLCLGHLAFPQYLDHYLNFALLLKGLCELVLANVRAHARIVRAENRIMELRHTESLGYLAGGLAHNINNLLTGAMGWLDIIKYDNPDNPELTDSVQTAELALQQIVVLVKQLLSCARTGISGLTPISLPELIGQLRETGKLVIPPAIQAEFSFDTPCPPIKGSVAQIEFILSSLITNAVEALADKPAGRIRFTCRPGILPADLPPGLNGHDLSVSGPVVILTVEDNGHGMDEDTRRHAFDPFFSTKFTGRGLGLAAVLGITRSHGGAISLQSKPGHGTTAAVVFPAAPPVEPE